MATKINKDQLGPLAISDADVSSISVEKLSQSGAQNGDTIAWDAENQKWVVSPASIGAIIVDDETPTGVIDGINREYSLSRVPSPTKSLQLFRGGVLMRNTVDYTLTDNQIEMSQAPEVNDVLTAYYRS